MANSRSSVHTVTNRLGLHARPASLFVQTASKFDSVICVRHADRPEEEPADGKSLMSLLILAAPQGTELLISAEGPDAEEALRAIGELMDRHFDEE